MKTKLEIVEEVFDQFRSSNQKDKNGKRRFGVPDFKVSARELHKQIIKALKK